MSQEIVVAAGQFQSLTGPFYGIQVLNTQLGATWAFDGSPIQQPITALAYRPCPTNYINPNSPGEPPRCIPQPWGKLDLFAPAASELRVLVWRQPRTEPADYGAPLLAYDSSNRQQVVPPGCDVLFDTFAGATGQLYSANPLLYTQGSGNGYTQSIPVSQYKVLKFYAITQVAFNGTSPTLSLSLYENPPHGAGNSFIRGLNGANIATGGSTAFAVGEGVPVSATYAGGAAGALDSTRMAQASIVWTFSIPSATQGRTDFQLLGLY